LTDSVVFDRAPGFYDRTRALAPATMDAVVAALAGELAGRGPVLEPGVGTGRMALPAAAAGVDVIGLDLSGPMLAELVAKRDSGTRDNKAQDNNAQGNGARVPLVRGDATRLPFPAGAFGGAYVVHLLHLVPAWADVVAELVRVVRAGGVILVEMGEPAGGVAHDINVRFEQAAGIERRHPGLTDGLESLDATMAARGARLRLLEPIVETRTVRPDHYIGRLEDNLFSWTWALDDASRQRAGAEVRAWAVERLGSLDRPQSVSITVAHRAYDLP
jgi:SAM-dependent methyltransferase